MVGGNGINQPFLDAGYKGFSVCFGAKGWIYPTVAFCPQLTGPLFREGEMMRGNLAGNLTGRTPPSVFLDQLQGFPGRNMGDMDGAPRFLGKAKDPLGAVVFFYATVDFSRSPLRLKLFCFFAPKVAVVRNANAPTAGLLKGRLQHPFVGQILAILRKESDYRRVQLRKMGYRTAVHPLGKGKNWEEVDKPQGVRPSLEMPGEFHRVDHRLGVGHADYGAVSAGGGGKGAAFQGFFKRKARIPKMGVEVHKGGHTDHVAS